MNDVVQQGSLVLSAAGVLCFLLGALVAGSWQAGLRMALDLWMAAGLLRLGSDSHGPQLAAAAAAIIAIRQLVGFGLRHGGPVALSPVLARRRGHG